MSNYLQDSSYSYHVTGTIISDQQFSISMQTEKNIHRMTHMQTLRGTTETIPALHYIPGTQVIM